MQGKGITFLAAWILLITFLKIRVNLNLWHFVTKVRKSQCFTFCRTRAYFVHKGNFEEGWTKYWGKVRSVLTKSGVSSEENYEEKGKIEGQKDFLRKIEESFEEKWGEKGKIEGNKYFWGKVRKDRKKSEEICEENWGKLLRNMRKVIKKIMKSES